MSLCAQSSLISFGGLGMVSAERGLAMVDIVYHDFRKNAASKEGPSGGNSEAAPAAISAEILDESIENRAFVAANEQLIKETKDIADKMYFDAIVICGYDPEDISIRFRRQGMKAYSLKELTDLIRLADKDNWKRQPMYHGALAQEFQIRLKAVQNAMPTKLK